MFRSSLLPLVLHIIRHPEGSQMVSTRTLETLVEKHRQYMDNGGNLKRAKLNENVIGETFFNIPLTQVYNYVV